jgi:hypothetical protein
MSTMTDAGTLTLDGISIRTDSDGMIGWMSDWGAPFDHDWIGRGLVETVDHPSGGLGGFSYRVTDAGKRQSREPGCVCARHDDGSVTTFLCPTHADTDPCLTMARVTGRRRVGSIIRGKCSSCGHGAR